MTALGIVDMLDSRVPRAGTAGSHSRSVTPGAAAFADVIQDASRTSGDDGDGVPSRTTTEDASPDLTGTPPAPAAPAPPAVLPAPGAALIDARHAVSAPSDEEVVPALTPSPADTPDAGAEAADTGSSTNDDDAVPAAPNGRHALSAGTAGAVAAAPAAPAAVTPAAVTAAPVTAAAVTPDEASRTPTVLPDAVATRTTPAATATGAASPTGIAPLGTAAKGDLAAPAAPRPALGAQGSPTTAVRAEVVASSASVPEGMSEGAAASLPAGSASAPAALPSPTPTASAAPGDAPTPLPAAGSTSAPTPVAAAPAAAPMARPVLLPQITAPVVSLAQAPDGDHSITLTVSPENLGPVTVRAHISGGAIHIELHAPNDLGRDALRAILVDLRRDLAGAAPHASLTLSTSDDGPGSSTPQNPANGNGASPGTAGGTNNGHQGSGTPAGRDPHGTRPAPDAPQSTPEETPAVPLVSPLGGIDVFA